MNQPYLTIKEDGSVEQTIKKSQFICCIFRIKNEEQAQEILAKQRSLHKKATHICFAYMTGDQDQIQRESDNGEPQGTAGVPILEVLKANKIHDVLAIVIRYFGGIKLGAGGLIRAYSSSCAQAIEAVGIVKRIIKTKVTITIEYPLWGKLQNFLTNEKIALLDTIYTDKIQAVVCVDSDKLSDFKQKIMDLLAGNCLFETGADVLNYVQPEIP